jgi:ATP-dependent protease ClpP protease subunit
MKKYDLYLTGTVGGWGISADYVKYVLDKHKDQPVDVAVCSLGGDVSAALQIYELIKNHGQVTAHFLGMSASAATFMVMGAKTVKMSKNALLLIHNCSSWVDSWGRFNKEQLDEIIRQLQFERKQLDTVDDVIANIYAERNGKSLDDVKEKMKVAAWIKASDAKDFGIVDEVIDAEHIGNAVEGKFNNSLIKDLGLPALPKGFDPETGEENPTSGIIQKVVEMLKGLVPEPSTNPVQNEMIKVFTAVMALLAVTDGFKPDEKGNVTLTQDQMKTIDDELRSQDDACKKASGVIDGLKKKIQDLENDIKLKNQQIANLKGSAPDDDGGTPTDETSALTGAAALFNSIKDAL